MPSSNEIIKSAWIGGKIGTMEKLCIGSFLRNGHKFHLYVSGDVGEVPKGTEIFDIEDVLPSSIFAAKDFSKNPASFSDIFRYHLIHSVGGWWVDLDTYCMRPFNFESEYVFDADRMKMKLAPQESYGSGEKVLRTVSGAPIYIINGTFKAPAGSMLLKEMMNRVKTSSSWLETGPSAFTKAILDKFPFFLDKVLCLPLLNPLSYHNLSRLWDDNQPQTLPEGIYAIHLYRSNWIELGADMETTKGIYGKLRRGEESSISYIPAEKWFTEEWNRAYLTFRAPIHVNSRPIRRFRP